MSYNMYGNWYLNYALQNFLSARHNFKSANVSTQSEARTLQSCAVRSHTRTLTIYTRTIRISKHRTTPFWLNHWQQYRNIFSIHLTHLICIQESDGTIARKPETYVHIKEEIIFWGEYTNCHFSSWRNPKAYINRAVLITVIYTILIKLQWRKLICSHLVFCEELPYYLLHEITENRRISKTSPYWDISVANKPWR
jgi:hypothetical protein